jgi:peptidoglycan/xylan/chitin deacetylase (PgdA/CDA1 family)
LDTILRAPSKYDSPTFGEGLKQMRRRKHITNAGKVFLCTVASFIGLAIALALIFPSLIPSAINLLLGKPVGTDTAIVSFTFDDGFQSTYSEAAPVLKKYGLTGVAYVPSGCVDDNDECRHIFHESRSFLTWDEVDKLQDEYGWEIAAHTVNHTNLTEMTAEERESELSESKEAFAEHGIDTVNFASPQGDYDPASLAQVAKYYNSHREFWKEGANAWPYHEMHLTMMRVQAGMSVSDVKKEIDEAIENRHWIILVFHDIKDSAIKSPDDYVYSTADLSEIAKYVKERQVKGKIETVTVNQALTPIKANLIPNPSFENAKAGYRTDNNATVVIDTENNGVSPSAEESIKFIGSPKKSHLYTRQFPTKIGDTFVFKAYVNTVKQTGGELGFVVDEYDWSGKWKSSKTLEHQSSSRN